jgi:transposase
VATCDRCQEPAAKFSVAQRTAIDLDLEQPVLLGIEVSVHYCSACHHYFRAQPPFLRRDGIYTDQVIEKAVTAVFEDDMAFRRVTKRLARDFWVQPCEGTIRRWCRLYGQGIEFATDYQAWVVREFSGILCVDEVYQGRLALLLAVDPGAPNGDRLIGYQLVQGTVNTDVVQDFLERLKQIGVQPEQVITDGSSLYPAVLAQVWPKAAHQLCLFHETRRITLAAMKAINKVRQNLPAPSHFRKSDWHGGPINAYPPVADTTHYATRRWYWRQVQRHKHIALVHELTAQGLSHRAISRQTGRHRKTVKKWLQQPVPPLPANLPADISPEAIILPEKQQRRWERQQKMKQVQQLSQQGLNFSAISRIVGIHRVTVKAWLQKEAETAVTSTAIDEETQPSVPPVPEGWSSWIEVQQVRELLRQNRFLFLRRPENLNLEDEKILESLLTSPVGKQLQTIRAFMVDWFQIWWDEDKQRRSLQEAGRRYEKWRSQADYLAVPALRRVIMRVTAAKFEQMSHFLKHEHWEATNNGAERAGKRFRQRQASHYNLRQADTIETSIVIDACLHRQVAESPTSHRFHHCQRGRQAQQDLNLN